MRDGAEVVAQAHGQTSNSWERISSPGKQLLRTHYGSHCIMLRKGKEMCLKMLAASVLMCVCTVPLQRLSVCWICLLLAFCFITHVLKTS